MPQPLFRQRITAWMQLRPAPIPVLWRGVDRIHFTTDAVIRLIEKAHMGIRDQIVLPAATRVGVAPAAIDTFRRRHTQFFGRVYRGLRTIHWYV